MNYDEVLKHCLATPGARQDEPWEGDIVVKVGSKVFAFLGTPGSNTVGVQCGSNRDIADEWLAPHPEAAAPSAYIGRSGWNRLTIDGAIPRDELIEAIDASYDM